jgi:GNAT superfamily N-acetyltransferase
MWLKVARAGAWVSLMRVSFFVGVRDRRHHRCANVPVHCGTSGRATLSNSQQCAPVAAHHRIMLIRPFRAEDEDTVIGLWHACGLTRPWNDPRRDIARKLTEQPELFLVGEFEGLPVASAMVGFDGHRGWVYYLAVQPGLQGKGYGRMLMAHAEQLLIERGCPKINLLVRAGNRAVIDFYDKLGYAPDEAVSLGKRLIPDLQPPGQTSNKETT